MHDSIWWMYYYMQLIRTNLTTETELKAWSKRRKRLSHNRTCRDYVLKKKKVNWVLVAEIVNYEYQRKRDLRYLRRISEEKEESLKARKEEIIQQTLVLIS